MKMPAISAQGRSRMRSIMAAALWLPWVRIIKRSRLPFISASHMSELPARAVLAGPVSDGHRVERLFDLLEIVMLQVRAQRQVADFDHVGGHVVRFQAGQIGHVD